MSMTVEDFLEHHGVKGQKWGVRRADKKWQKNIYSIRGALAVHNESADRFNARIGAINDKHPKAHLDQDTPETKAYIRDVEKMSLQTVKEAVDKIHGVSPSGTLRARYDPNRGVVVEPVDAQHADDTLPTMVFEVNIVNGKISSLRKIDDSVSPMMAQSSTELGEDFVEHHGVKGQKWGVRRSKAQLRVSADRKKVDEALKKKKKSGVKSLTNHEIRTLNQRLQMEQQLKQLQPKKKSVVKSGHNFVKEALAIGATANAVLAFAQSPAGKKLAESMKR